MDVVGELLCLANRLAEEVAMGIPVRVDVVGGLLKFADGLAERVESRLSVGVGVVGKLLWFAGLSMRPSVGKGGGLANGLPR